MSEARAHSVEQLCALYNVVMGLALTIAVSGFIDAGKPVPIRWNIIPNLVSFLAIAIPFYHGAVRHLYATYVEGGGSSKITNFALLGDFIILFIEGCLFVLIASVIAHPIVFIWAIVSLLAIDSVWGLLAWLALGGANAQLAEKKWAILNLATVVAITAGMISMEFSTGPVPIGVAVAATIVLRSVLDYLLSWGFYYPP